MQLTEMNIISYFGTSHSCYKILTCIQKPTCKDYSPVTITRIGSHLFRSLSAGICRRTKSTARLLLLPTTLHCLYGQLPMQISEKLSNWPQQLLANAPDTLYKIDKIKFRLILSIKLFLLQQMLLTFYITFKGNYQHFYDCG